MTTLGLIPNRPQHLAKATSVPRMVSYVTNKRRVPSIAGTTDGNVLSFLSPITSFLFSTSNPVFILEFVLISLAPIHGHALVMEQIQEHVLQNPLDVAAKEVTAALTHANYRHGFIGGHAVSLVGGARTTDVRLLSIFSILDTIPQADLN